MGFSAHLSWGRGFQLCLLVFSSSPWPRERLFFFFQQKAVRRVCKLETGLFMVLLRAPAPGRAESTSPSSHPREDLASPSYIGSRVPEAWKVCVGASHLFKEAGISLSALAYSGQREERRTEVGQGRVWRVFSLGGKKKKNQLMNWHPGHSPAWKWSPPCRHTKGHQPPKQTLGELVYLPTCPPRRAVMPALLCFGEWTSARKNRESPRRMLFPRMAGRILERRGDSPSTLKP